MSASLNEECDLEDQSESVLLDPTNVRERIDATLEQLAKLKVDRNRTVSRVDLMNTLAK